MQCAQSVAGMGGIGSYKDGGIGSYDDKPLAPAWLALQMCTQCLAGLAQGPLQQLHDLDRN